MQTDTADDLDMIMFEFENAPCRFAHDRKRIVQNVVQRFARFETVFEQIRLAAKLCVGHNRIFLFKRFDAARHFIQFFQTATPVAVEYIVYKSHKLLPCAAARNEPRL